MIKTLYWNQNNLYILDQRLLPLKTKYILCNNHTKVAKTIKDMAIRGAPAIGVAAAFGVYIASCEKSFNSVKELKRHLEKAINLLGSTRPTAVNLFWALDRMQSLIRGSYKSVDELRARLKKEVFDIFENDVQVNKKIGANGARLIRKNSRILTHCNAGALATAGYGTALGIIRSAFEKRKVKMVFVDETRPYLQGARLTTWELKQEGIPFVLITDNMAGHFMQMGAIDAIIVGADRIASNGDVANKIGTYSLAVLAKHHKIPFYVAAPTSSIDFSISCGSRIEIEERSTEEVVNINRNRIAPIGTVARHPAFDVTPNKYITAIITEKGVFKPRNLTLS